MAARMNFLSPFMDGENYPITQMFGENPDLYPRTKGHNGVDYGCWTGTRLRAGFDGKVLRAAMDASGYGMHVRLVAHGRKDMLLYGHMSELWVKAGESVSAGDVIGLSGWTGNVRPPGVAGSHLHFEYRPDGVNAVDPLPWIVTDTPEVNPPLPAPGKIVATGDLISVSTTYLNIRTGPGTDFAVAGYVGRGENSGAPTFRVEDIDLDGQGRRWYRINGAPAWLAGWLCEAAA